MVVIAQLTGLLVVIGILFLTPSNPGGDDLLWGVGAGVSGAAGLILLYRSLATGPMNLVAPTAAVVGALVPVAVGLVSGERPGRLVIFGIALAVAAVALLGVGPEDRIERAGGLARSSLLLAAAGAGVGLGLANALFAQTSIHGGLWPLGVARLTAVLIFAPFVLPIARTRREWPLRGIGIATAAGLADGAATVSIVLALQRGPLVHVAILGAFFPAVTVILARVVLDETIRTTQMIGLGCAVGAVALVTTG